MLTDIKRGINSKNTVIVGDFKTLNYTNGKIIQTENL